MSSALEADYPSRRGHVNSFLLRRRALFFAGIRKVDVSDCSRLDPNVRREQAVLFVPRLNRMSARGDVVEFEGARGAGDAKYGWLTTPTNATIQP